MGLIRQALDTAREREELTRQVLAGIVVGVVGIIAAYAFVRVVRKL